MTANGNGGWSGLVKTFLSSPVGGWALAVILVTGMAWLTFKDRQEIYADVVRLRENAMPLIKATDERTKEILALLREKYP